MNDGGEDNHRFSSSSQNTLGHSLTKEFPDFDKALKEYLDTRTAKASILKKLID